LRFIFITGCSGSGTTMILKIMSTPSRVLTLGGNYTPIKDPLINEFKELTKLMWDRFGDITQHLGAKKQIPRVVESLLGKYKRKDILLCKRSAPFGKGDRYTPQLSDIVELFKDCKIVIMTRNPIYSTLSSFRRSFGTNLRNTAIMCDEQLSNLNSQLALIDPSIYKIIRYEDYCLNPKKGGIEISKFCNLPQGCILTGNIRVGVKTNTGNEVKLTQYQKDWLTDFFVSKKDKWPTLMGGSYA